MGCGRVRCAACGKIHALTALEMVRNTSERMGNPSVALTLTSWDPYRDVEKTWAKDVEQVIRALRRRCPTLEYLGFMEWTEGSKARDGLRRPHMHALMRGVPLDLVDDLEQLTRKVWTERTGAHVVELAPLRAAANGVAYLALHHLKPAQHAPEGWSGRRLRPSRGWWGAPAKELREWARENVRDSGHRHKLKEARKQEAADLVEQGVPEEVAHELVCGDPLPARETGAEVVRLKRMEKAA
jgi:hypothetical protein